MAGADIRIATEQDFAEMHRVRMIVRENRLSDPVRIGLSDYAAILAAGGRGWVAEVGDRIVGFAVADLARRNIWALFVEPGFEGRGIGRRLHNEMVAWLVAQGADEIWLGTDPGTRAEAFYRAAGWQLDRMEANGEARYVLEPRRDASAADP